MVDFLAQLGANNSYAFVLIFGGLLWARFLGMVGVIPFLFGKPVPMRVRVGSAFVLAMFVLPILLPDEQPAVTNDLIVLGMLFVKEALIGVTIGFIASIIFYAFEAAGGMIDDQRGMSIARLLIPQLGTMGSLTGQLLFQMVIVVYLALGGHQLFLEAFYNSFVLLPVLEFPRIHPGWWPVVQFVMYMTGEVIRIAFAIAAPVVISILITDIIMGVANRIAPQINVWEMSFNIKGYVGVLLVYYMMGMMLDVMKVHFDGAQGRIEHSIQLMHENGEPPPTPDTLTVVPQL